MKLKFAVFGERDLNLSIVTCENMLFLFSLKLRWYFVGVCIVRSSMRMLTSKKVAKRQILKYAILPSLQ